MHFIPASEAAGQLHPLLTAYYREGEDADTPQEVLDEFIVYLTELLDKQLLSGVIALDQDTPVGFVLYAADTEGYPFSEYPGMGTIAEICVLPEYRMCGLGRRLVEQAEHALAGQVTQMYVCAHASAQAFWQRCGYRPTGDSASNELPLYIKSL